MLWLFQYIALFHNQKSALEAKSFSEVSKSYFTDLLQGLVTNGNELKPIFVNGGWLEFDTISDFELYEKMIENDSLGELINFDR